METYNVYKDISERTGGDIYIGVVGPVRTGKSTFIKHFMELLVLPNIKDEHDRERVTDELPQSGSGRMIMTTQPRFVPNEAINIDLDDKVELKVRMVDCVGFMVDGAAGADDEGEARLVRTPWSDIDIPFEQAADIGTRKVIDEHSTIGIVMTTDGSICDIPRGNYVAAEERTVMQLKKSGKPFVIILNTADAESEMTAALRASLEEKYEVPVIALNVMLMQREDITEMLRSVLYEFPVKQISFNISKWVCALSDDHRLLLEILDKVRESTSEVKRVRDYEGICSKISKLDCVTEADIRRIALGEGRINVDVDIDDNLFYSVIGEECGCDITDDRSLVKLVKELVNAKKEYDRLEAALMSVKSTGYGIVPPMMDDISLEEPEMVQQGNKFGVKLKANAPSMHIIKVDVQTEVSPIIGTEKQSEELLSYMLKEFENDPAKIWSTDMFGKSMHELVKEGLNNKLSNIPDDARFKMQETLERMVNEGNAGMLCILL